MPAAGIKFVHFSQIIDMKRVKTFDEMKTRDERESCFPAASGRENRNLSAGADLRGGGEK
ncbi:MAG: hypothetical protein DBY05_01050 [Clostridiales bacterium]|nr:MAG: hypothetical protein DBY05_01050 [Clostridiales bacterium]